MFAALAFQQPAPGQTRIAAIEAERDSKAKILKPDRLDSTEAFFRRMQDEKWLERISAGYNGLRLKLGNMTTGAGFAIGPEYHREDLFGGFLLGRVAAQATPSKAYKIETEWKTQPFAGGLLTADFYAAHRNINRVNYYGPGPDSRKSGRTDYRLEDTYYWTSLTFSPVRVLRVSGATGYSWINVGPGQDKRFASAETVYRPSQSPGIDTQTNFLPYGGLLEVDYRDSPTGPKHGGHYLARQTWFEDRRLGQHDFRRLDLDFRQYIGFFNRTRVIALRARSTLTEASSGHSVPFYLQPSIGGPDDLRGFRPFRFTGPNALVLNAEYRWEVFSGLDGALFYDAGKVFARRGQFNLSNLEGSAGFGIRFNVKNATFMRIDAGFSHEGWQIWIKFNDAFLPRLAGSPVAQPLY